MLPFVTAEQIQENKMRNTRAPFPSQPACLAVGFFRGRLTSGVLLLGLLQESFSCRCEQTLSPPWKQPRSLFQYAQARAHTPFSQKGSRKPSRVRLGQRTPRQRDALELSVRALAEGSARLRSQRDCLAARGSGARTGAGRSPRQTETAPPGCRESARNAAGAPEAPAVLLQQRGPRPPRGRPALTSARLSRLIRRL